LARPSLRTIFLRSNYHRIIAVQRRHSLVFINERYRTKKTLSKTRTLRRHQGLFASGRVIGVIGFPSPSESYDGRLQRNPHVGDLLLCRGDRARRGLAMKQTDNALTIRAAGTDARLNLRSNLGPLAINLARTWTCIAR
jgi:hypothetical protein